MIKRKTNKRKPVIDISGPGGNAFCIMGQAVSLCRQLKIDSKPILDEMKSGDYEHLIAVFDKNFGHIVDLER